MQTKADSEGPIGDSALRINLLGKPEVQLADFFEELGEKPFRARQVLQWVHQRNVSRFDDMTDLSKQLRAQLCAVASIELPQAISEKKSVDGTVKWLFSAGGNQAVETVFIPEKTR